MAMKIKPNGLKALAVLLIVALGAWYYMTPKAVKEHKQLELVLPDAPTASTTTETTLLPFPSTEPTAKGSQITWVQMAWNSQLGSHYSNGGPVTTKGSIMESNGIKLTLKTNNDCYQSGDDFVTYWEQNKDNLDNCPGYMVSYMFDGEPYLAARIQAKLEKIGLHVECIGFAGKSDGEDKFMAPLLAKSNPMFMKGKNVALVTMDGDQNNLSLWCKDNGLQMNPDPETWDSSKVNVISVKDYLEAAKFYNSKATVKKFIIKNGKRTNDQIEVSADGGCATWTPGDAMVAYGRGGLYVANSTKGSTQMPNGILSVKEWNEKHRDVVEKFLKGILTGGDQVRNFKDCQAFAANISAKVYNMETGAYWLKYYRGLDTTDVQGLRVQLGGSQAFNLNDNLAYLNPQNGNKPIAQVVYETFGNQTLEYYGSSDFKSYIPYAQIVNNTYINSVSSKYSEMLQGKAIEDHYSSGDIVDVQGKADYQIQYSTGSAVISKESYKVLNEIADRLLVQKSQKVELYGFTDNTGNDESNLQLSNSRANAVKEYLMRKGVDEKRLTSTGKGEISEGNETESGKAKNRKVQIIVGQ